MNPMHRYYSGELRLAREAHCLSQQQLADKIHFSPSTVAMVETGNRLPSVDFSRAVDELFSADGRFQRMQQTLIDSAEVRPEWFKPWTDTEGTATEIRWFEPLVVPGLLQTEEYARWLLGTEELVAGRLKRQQVISSARVTAIVEENVLRRMVGSDRVMSDQLQALLDSPATVLVLPDRATTNLHLDGSFAVATVDGSAVGYVDTPARGFVVAEAAVVSGLLRRWEEITCEALPRALSREIIRGKREEWEQYAEIDSSGRSPATPEPRADA